MRYQVTFLDHGGRVFSTSQLEAPSSDEAVSVARRVYSSGLGAAFQIWDGETLVHTEWLGARGKEAKSFSLPFLHGRHTVLSGT